MSPSSDEMSKPLLNDNRLSLKSEVEKAAILLWSKALLYCCDQNQRVTEYAKQLSKSVKDSGCLNSQNLTQMPSTEVWTSTKQTKLPQRSFSSSWKASCQVAFFPKRHRECWRQGKFHSDYFCWVLRSTQGSIYFSCSQTRAYSFQACPRWTITCHVWKQASKEVTTIRQPSPQTSDLLWN